MATQAARRTLPLIMHQRDTIAPGQRLRFEEICRRHPEMAWVQRTMERRIARWRARKPP